MDSHSSSSPSPAPSPVSTAPSTPPEVSCSGFNVRSTQNDSTTSFKRWRPSYHLQPSSGWLNDPCAPFYDPKTGVYHVSFQWNPNGPDWGDISWGTATSTDLLHWRVQEQPILQPETPYDREGIFTGCQIPSAPLSSQDGSEQQEVLTVAYTSVNQLPIHHTLPHARGSESLSIVQSYDHGKTWQRHPDNPVLPHEPEELEVTGWRDPFVAPWPAMSELLQLDPSQTLFGIVSGGIRDRTPTTFLYAIDRFQPSRWKYIGPLVNVGPNRRLSKWSGDLGKNWEVVNFVTLNDRKTGEDVQLLVMGTEGCEQPVHGPSAGAGLTRPVRGQLWMSGPLKADQPSSPVRMEPKAIGHLDHGCLYAANSFKDPISGQQIVWGWITEDDLCDELRHTQGWSGMLSLPRELRIQTLQHVTRARVTPLDQITSLEIEIEKTANLDPASRQLWTVRTLESEPVSRVVEALRDASGVRCSFLEKLPLNSSNTSSNAMFSTQELQTSTWELSCSLAVSSSCNRVGFRVTDTSDSTVTIFNFLPQEELITMCRPSSASKNMELINSKAERAPHTLFSFFDPETGVEREETLDVRVWRDNSVLEVFVNGRTSISTRIYTADEAQRLTFFAEDFNEDHMGDGTERGSELLHASLWDGIGL